MEALGAAPWGQRMEGSWHASGAPCQDLHRPYSSVPENFLQSSQSLKVSKIDSSKLPVCFILLHSCQRDLTVA